MLLGGKAFCTTGCPYGAFFAIADRFAPVRIVADGCRQAGHCTPACTSNVLVHAEVRKHAMVVDSGCMKCMDCVDACPNEALSVGLAKPSLLVGRAAAASAERLPWSEEILGGAVMLGSTLAFRGLYGGPPLLMAAGLGAATAFLAVQVLRLARQATVRVQSWTLKAGGEWTRGGRLFAAGAGAWLLFAAHSGLVQAATWRGLAWLDRSGAPREQVLAGRFDLARATPELRTAARRAESHLSIASRLALVRMPQVELGLSWLALLRGDSARAETIVRDVLARDPSDPARHENLVELLAAQGRLPEAEAALEAKIAATGGGAADDHFRLGTLRAALGDLEGAAAPLLRAAELAPANGAARYNAGALLRRLGRTAEALPHLEAAAALLPGDAQAAAELEAARAEAGP